MSNTRNVVILAGNLVLAAIALIAFCTDRITGEQLGFVFACLGVPSLASLRRQREEDRYVTYVGTGGGGGGGSSPPGAKPGKGGGTFLSSVVFVLGLFVAGVELEACGPGSSAPSLSTPAAEAVAGGACKGLEAFTANAVVKTVCANRDELVEAAALILRMREQTSAGMPVYARGPCKPIPSTTVCATNDETLEAIDSLLARRGGKP